MSPRRSKDPLEGVNLLDLAPRRIAEWTEDEGRVVVDAVAPAHPWRDPLDWISYKISTKKIRLDEVGGRAWRLLDGERTVLDVADELREEFGERVEPAEERLGELVRQFHRGGLIEYS